MMMKVKMKILFITGSLAAGRDGVADYTLRVGHYLQELGHDVRYMAWSESSLRGPQTQPDTLRLPRHLPLRAKHAQAKHFLSHFVPDVISLQFVPYAFHPKGLAKNLATELKAVIGNTPLHVFIHELWVMPCMRSSIVSRLAGLLWQKNIVLGTLRALAPRVLHTSTPLYRDTLVKENLPVGELLPLPGNIPLARLSKNTPEKNHRVIGFFGNIFSSAPLERFCNELIDLQSQTGIQLTLFSAGNLPSGVSERWQKLTKNFAGRLNVERLGHLSPREASYYLQSLDFLASGYSPTFWQKSGTIAAARELGKPVVLISPAELPENLSLPLGVLTRLTAETLAAPPTTSPISILPLVAQKFLQSFEEIASSAQ